MAEQSIKSPTVVAGDNLLSMPRRSLHRIEALQEHGLISAETNTAQLRELTDRYAIAVTPAMLDQMDKTNLAHDPVALQFVPDIRELHILPEEETDPIGDYKHAPLKALVHRHTNRVLLKPTLACAVYCRFCFRREMIGPHGDTVTQQDVDDALDYIASHPEIKEVILTGGDPLLLSANRVQSMMQRLGAIDHLDWIRIHTRIPVVQPDKMTKEMQQALQSGGKPVAIALHINHVRELSDAAVQAITKLRSDGHMLLSQSVLLRHINDSADTLQELYVALVKHGVRPYYLHHADLTAGTSHFRVSLDAGIKIMKQLRKQASGLCVPDYVLDIPGGVCKIPVNGDHVQSVAGTPGSYRLTDFDGQTYLYRDPAVIAE